MSLVWQALALSTAVTLALFIFTPYRRLQMTAAIQRSKWIALQGFLVVIIGYVVPIYLLLLLASCVM
jgi:hypothetical protein